MELSEESKRRSLESRVDRLERANERLRRWLLGAGVLLALVVPGLVGWTAFGGDGARGNATFNELRVRQLVLEDEQGMPRLELTTDTPDPPLYGRRFLRQGGGQAGIIFYDGDGMEQGGLVTGHRGGISMGVDSKAGQQGSLWVNAPGSEAGIEFYLPAEDGQHRAALTVSEEGGPRLLLMRDGDTVARIPTGGGREGGTP